MTRTPSSVLSPAPAITATSSTLQPGFYIVPRSMSGTQDRWLALQVLEWEENGWGM